MTPSLAEPAVSPHTVPGSLRDEQSLSSTVVDESVWTENPTLLVVIFLKAAH